MSDLAERVGNGEEIVIVGEKNQYTLCRYLETMNGVEYYCCKGRDGLWRILGAAEIHRYNGQVKRLARSLRKVRRRCRGAEEDYSRNVINAKHDDLDSRAAHMINGGLYTAYPNKRMKEDLVALRNIEFERFQYIGRSLHYAWLFPRLKECFTAPELGGRRVIILEPQDIDLDGTVCLQKLLDESKKLSVDTVVWIVDWLCRVADLLLHGNMILKINMNNVYIEPATRRLFILDWAGVFFLDQSLKASSNNSRSIHQYFRGIDHFLTNISRIGKLGMEMLNVDLHSKAHDGEAEEAQFVEYLRSMNKLNLTDFEWRSSYGIEYDENRHDKNLEERFRLKIAEIWAGEDVEKMVE